MKKILILGSGMVAPPCVDYLVRNPQNQVTIGELTPDAHLCAKQNSSRAACRNLISAEKLASRFPRTNAMSLDVSSTTDLDKHVSAYDVVISLVPYIYHAKMIKAAIKSQTHVITTSYVTEATRALDAAAKQAGIAALNEVGVDPGVDHLYAIKKINEVHAKGGKVREFYSFCGGLPAPDCAQNPLGFKFSWSPRGALLSQRNSARFLQDGRIIEISSAEFMAKAKPYYAMEGYDFVAYPNRDSVPFREFYNIPEAHTVIRGSLRYDGNPAFVQALANLGWLKPEKKDWLKDGMTWAEVQQRALAAPATDENSLISRIKELAKFPTEAESERIISGMKWMGILSSEKATVAGGNLLDTLCARLEKLMSFQPGERDLVMLQHKFEIEWADGQVETCTSTLELLSDPKGYSAMALSVGVTCGIATQLILDGHPALCKPGVRAPYTAEMCEPIRVLLEKEGIKMVEANIER
ncbi:MAG: hypothetical protein Q9167_001986 [Letrouitia subvulpina]